MATAETYSTEKGLQLIEVKNKLLVMYLMDLSYLILTKPQKGHPAVLMPEEIYTALEKLCLLNQKLKY